MESRFHLILSHCFLWFLLSGSCHSSESDIQCLATIQKQLKDPNMALSTWNFARVNGNVSICKFSGIECWHEDDGKVLNIHLSDMGLEGWFPSGLKKCQSLIGLDLSNNNLSGPLPTDIDSIIPFVMKLDLSSNHFSGELPAALGNITYLNELTLDHNHFSGEIPWELARLNRLSSLNLSDNSLSGPIPNLGKSFSTERFANNNGLCGLPLARCTESHKKPNYWVAMGGAVGGILFSQLVIAAAVIFALRKQSRKKAGDREEPSPQL